MKTAEEILAKMDWNQTKDRRSWHDQLVDLLRQYGEQVKEELCREIISIGNIPIVDLQRICHLIRETPMKLRKPEARK